MADYNINAITRRVVFTGSAGVGPYAFSFEVLDQNDVAVYFNTTSLTLTTDYTVTVNANGTGSVTLVTGSGVPTTPTASDTVIIIGARDIERVTDFVTAGDLLASSLNEQLDALTIINQQLAEEGQRSMRAPVYDPALVADGGTLDMTLPPKADRVDTVMAFDTNGNPVKGPTVAGVATMVSLAADIATLADIEDGTVATDAISDTAAIAANVTTVAGIAPNVTTVAGNTANVNTVAGNTANINTVAGNNANVTTVAGISGNVTTAAGISADITAVAADATDIGTVSTNIANVNTVAGISADVTTVAADGTDIGVVAGISSDVTTVSGISANVTSVAGNAANINTVAADGTDIGTVATNIANVNTAAGISANITTVAGISADVTAAATNASDISAIAAEVAKVVTVANDLNEAVSEIDTVANSIANVDLVGASITDVNTVASNLSGITAFSEVYASGPNDPTTNLNEGDLFFNTTSDTLKVYNGSAWEQGVTAGSGFLALSGGQLTGNLTFSSTQTVDGRDVSVDGTKLDGIEAGATADQTAAEIRALVESATDSNVFTDADHTKLNGIESGATADQSASEILTAIKTVDGSGSGLDADLLDGVDSGSFLRSDVADTKTSGDLSFADSVKCVFGAGSDLQIYHNGSNSYIDDSGTGQLLVRSSLFNVQKYTGETMAKFLADGAVTLYYDNAAKLSTTASGVSVTGTLAATALTGNGSGITNLPTSGYNAPWVNFNGTGTVAIRDSLLTSSISDLGTGDYRHNFSSSCANSSYAVANGGSRDDPENSRTFMIHIDNLATGSYDISCHNDGSTSVDFTNLFSITQGDF